MITRNNPETGNSSPLDRRDHLTEPPATPPKSPMNFALLWFAVPLVLLVLMACLGHRS